MAFPKLVKGLIETEPLHFTCVNTSEGTRLEMADSVSANVQTTINNILPIVMSSGQTATVTAKKEDLQQFIQKYMEKNQSFATHLSDMLDQNKFELGKMLEEAEQALDQKMGK